MVYRAKGAEERAILRTLHLGDIPLMKALTIVSFCLLLLSTLVSFAPAQAAKSDQAARTSALLPTMTLTASPMSAYVGDEITFYANASSDIPGATLIYTIFYDYYDYPYGTPNPEGAVSVNTTPNPGTVVTHYAYNTVGNFTAGGKHFFWVYLFVDDGTENQSAYIQVFVNNPPVNEPPWILSSPDNPLGTIAGTENLLTLYIADNNSDTVNVTWDFGDGNITTNTTVAPPLADGGAFVLTSHTWNPKVPGYDYGYYWLNISVSDGVNPPVLVSCFVNVSILQKNWPPILQFAASRTQAAIDDANGSVEVAFYANASDPEGDPLTWTFNYTDGSPLEVYQSTEWTAPRQLMWMNTTHVFRGLGNHSVIVYVTDALVPHQVGYHNVSRTLNVELVLNRIPYAGPITVGTNPLIEGVKGYVDVNITCDVVDHDGDLLTLTWSLDGVVIGTNTTGGIPDYTYTALKVIRFNNTGEYNVSLSVTDGRAGHELQRYKIVNVTSNNLPPDVRRFNHTAYAAGDYATPNETLQFIIVITDPELNTIEVSIDFGDGSPKIFLNLSNFDSGKNATIFLNHSYSEYGNYTVTLNITDNKVGLLNHTKSYTMPIRVWVKPPKEYVQWDLWDYTSLGLFLMIPVVMVLWFFFLRFQRKRIEDQGMTYDEWKLKSKLKPEAPKK